MNLSRKTAQCVWDCQTKLHDPRTEFPHYFDYKGGNIVDLFDNSNETVTSSFAFILSSLFSQYKDLVHVMPTKCLQVENLFDIVKRIIISLKEIGFQVLSIITDDDTINKKAIYFFVVHQSFQLYIHIQLWNLDSFSSNLIQFIY